MYSFDVSYYWTFEKILANYECHVFAFDPGKPEENNNQHLSRIKFYSLNLADRDNNEHLHGWKIKTLTSIYEIMQPKQEERVTDYLKFNGQGYERTPWTECIHKYLFTCMTTKLLIIYVALTIFKAVKEKTTHQ